MNTKQQELVYGTKEYIKSKLEGQKVIYVSFLNQAYSKFHFWYIDKKDMTLDKVWISPEYDENNNKLPFNDKPRNWRESRIESSWKYCFHSSDTNSALITLYRWLGYTDKDIFEDHIMPRIENLN